MERSVVPPPPDTRLGLRSWPSGPRVTEVGAPSMVSQTCLIGFTVGALVIGVLVGLLWSSRQGHGEHAAYDPAFSAAAVIDRVRASQSVPAEDHDQDDAEPAPPAVDVSDEPAPAEVVDVRLYGRHPDDPGLFHYHVSAPPVPINTTEPTTPLPRLPSQAANRRALPPPHLRPEAPHGRHAFRLPSE